MNSFFRQKILPKLQKIPFSLPLLITIICIYGFLVLYSAAGGKIVPWAYKQIIIFFIFMPIALTISIIDTRFIYKLSYFLYFLVLFLLTIVAFIGKTAMGAKRWINLGLFHVQPSELTKITVVLMLARYFHSIKKQDISSIYNLIIPIVGILLPVILIAKQPDLGTAIITIIVGMVIFFAVGVRKLYFIIFGTTGLISLPVIWNFLHHYQKNRILIFLNPNRAPRGAGYNIIQSKIAIGSGGFGGKGFLNGTQGHLSFLPEYNTDFVFSFLAEEFGFLGGTILLGLYFMLIVSSLLIAHNTNSVFKKLMVIGLISIFFSHIFINTGMVMGILPVVGVPLPFISYGGTMMVSMLVSFGLIMNASVHQAYKL